MMSWATAGPLAAIAKAAATATVEPLIAKLPHNPVVRVIVPPCRIGFRQVLALLLDACGADSRGDGQLRGVGRSARIIHRILIDGGADRKGVVWGKSVSVGVDLGVRGII